MDILFGILTIVLVLVSAFMILVVLMQRGNANGGLGAAMGGGMAESAFGAETSNVLTKVTRNTAIVFFVMTFGLYLAQLWLHREAELQEEGTALPEFATEEPSAAQNALQELMSESAELQSESSSAAAGLQTEAEAATEEAPAAE